MKIVMSTEEKALEMRRVFGNSVRQWKNHFEGEEGIFRAGFVRRDSNMRPFPNDLRNVLGTAERLGDIGTYEIEMPVAGNEGSFVTEISEAGPSRNEALAAVFDKMVETLGFDGSSKSLDQSPPLIVPGLGSFIARANQSGIFFKDAPDPHY